MLRPSKSWIGLVGVNPAWGNFQGTIGLEILELSARLMIDSAPSVLSDALLQALAKDDVAVINQALANGLNPHSCSAEGIPLLALAAEVGAVESTKVLLAAGAVVDQGDADQWTPLMAAAGGNHVEILKLLLAAGANVNAQTTFGLTPLMAAAAKGQLGATEALLGAGADLNLRDQNSWTALVWALEAGHTEVVQALKVARAKSLG